MCGKAAPFDNRFARQNCYGPPPEFPLASPYSGIVHHLSGRNRYTLTRLISGGGTPMYAILQSLSSVKVVKLKKLALKNLVQFLVNFCKIMFTQLSTKVSIMVYTVQIDTWPLTYQNPFDFLFDWGYIGVPTLANLKKKVNQCMLSQIGCVVSQHLTYLKNGVVKLYTKSFQLGILMLIGYSTNIDS